MKTVNHLFNKGWKKVKEGEVKVESFIGLVQVNHLLLQQLIQILVLQHRLSQNEKLHKYWDQKLGETPNKASIFFPCKTQLLHICYLVHVNSQVWSSTTFFEVF